MSGLIGLCRGRQMHASGHGHKGIVRLLLEAIEWGLGDDGLMRELRRRSDLGETALWLACFGGHTGVSKVMMMMMTMVMVRWRGARMGCRDKIHLELRGGVIWGRRRCGWRALGGIRRDQGDDGDDDDEEEEEDDDDDDDEEEDDDDGDDDDDNGSCC
jgi:hypothetical protein